MNLELPKQFNISFASVFSEFLQIYRLTRFEDFMYELTYALRDSFCIYCGIPLTQKNRTLDHRYPRAVGGISITNNLFPCCQKCNSHKSSLTHYEYLKFKELAIDEQKNFRASIEKSNMKIFRKVGYKLPHNWITIKNVEQITYYRSPVDLRGKTYHRILDFYNTFGNLPRPAIVDCDNNLLDGYNLLLFAKDYNIAAIPVIRLENVLLAPE